MTRFKLRKVLFSTACRVKSLVERRDIRSSTQYVMVSAPTMDLQNKPNTVRKAVEALLKVDHPHVIPVSC